MNNHNPLEKIQALDAIEKEICQCIQSAGECEYLFFILNGFSNFLLNFVSGQALLELSKEKSSQKAAENHTSQFLKSLNIVESKLSDQLNYLQQVSTGSEHKGSGYASAKVLQMAWHRIHHAKSRLKELEECKAKHIKKSVNSTPGGNI